MSSLQFADPPSNVGSAHPDDLSRFAKIATDSDSKQHISRLDNLTYLQICVILRSEMNRKPDTRTMQETFSPDSIRSLRRKHGLSQAKFAELLGVALSSVCNWESGRSKITKRSAKKLDRFSQLTTEQIARKQNKLNLKKWAEIQPNEFSPEALRTFRESHNITTDVLACLLGVSKHTINNWVSGRSKPRAPWPGKIEALTKLSEERINVLIAEKTSGFLDQKKHEERAKRLVAECKSFRRKYNLAQRGVCILLGTKQQIISYWESGKEIPNKSNLDALEHLLGLSDDEVYALIKEKAPDAYHKWPKPLPVVIPPEDIRALRESNNLTKAEFSRLVGVTDFAVSKWETGETHPKPKYLESIEAIRKLSKEQIQELLATKPYYPVKHPPKHIADAIARIIDFRKKFNISRRAFSAMLGVSKSNTTKWETGRTMPKESQLDAIYRITSLNKEEAYAMIAEKAPRALAMMNTTEAYPPKAALAKA